MLYVSFQFSFHSRLPILVQPKQIPASKEHVPGSSTGRKGDEVGAGGGGSTDAPVVGTSIIIQMTPKKT